MKPHIFDLDLSVFWIDTRQMDELKTVGEIENYLTTEGGHMINIWTNLQESFDNDAERIQTFNKILRKNKRTT